MFHDPHTLYLWVIAFLTVAAASVAFAVASLTFDARPVSPGLGGGAA